MFGAVTVEHRHYFQLQLLSSLQCFLYANYSYILFTIILCFLREMQVISQNFVVIYMITLNLKLRLGLFVKDISL